MARVGNGARFTGRDPLRLLGPALNGVTSGLYRGAMELRTDGGGVTAINVLDLDSYVRGVVAGEMPSSWPLEALKSQAVAARTYALATRKTDGAVRPVPRHPLADVPRRDRGERAQRRGGARHRGPDRHLQRHAAVTYYFSTSGGHTEDIEFSFVGALSKPWLVGVTDPYDDLSPYHRWTVRDSDAAIDRALGAPGKFKKVKVLERGVSPRVVKARVIGTKGSRMLSGPTIRTRLGPARQLVHVRAGPQQRPLRALGTARQLGRPAVTPTLAGEFSPAPTLGVLLLERRVGARWRRAASPHVGLGPLPGLDRSRRQLPRPFRRRRRPCRAAALRRGAALAAARSASSSRHRAAPPRR